MSLDEEFNDLMKKKRLTVKLIILWYFDACIGLEREKIIITSFKSII